MLNTKAPRHYVWKRSDGHVGCTSFVPANLPHHTFEVVSAFDAWDKAIPGLIQHHRNLAHNARSATLRLAPKFLTL